MYFSKMKYRQKELVLHKNLGLLHIKKGSKFYFDPFLVPVVGVEPTRYRYHGILSPARLPIPPHRRKDGATGRNRTGDLFITSEPLYRLSHGSTISIISKKIYLST